MGGAEGRYGGAGAGSAQPGLQTGEIRPGARNLPDGSRLAWKTLGFAPSASPLLPFFIEWDPAGGHPSSTSPAGCRLTGFALKNPAPAACASR